jgi:S1-C subfamily serine protease
MVKNPRPQRRPFAVLAAVTIAATLFVGALGASAQSVSAPKQSLSLQQLFKLSAPSVVFITQTDGNGKVLSLASGFVVSPSGVIVTNHHVIAPDPGAVQLTIKLPRGDVYTDVRVIYAEARRDFAVLSIKATGLPALKVGDSDKVEVGDQVVAIGNPMGLELTFTEGIVESVRLDPSKGYRFIQHQAPISPGSSGGPLLNMNGEVVGINAFNIKDAQNLNGAIPINYVKPYFGDAAKVTWQEYARVSAVTPSAAAPAPGPVAPPAAVPPPAQPAPPRGNGGAPGPGTFFESSTDYRGTSDSFKGGFTAGFYDAVSLFAAAAGGANGIDNQAVLVLFQCIDTHGDQLGQLRSWVDSIVAHAPSGDYAVVSTIARECRRSFLPGPTFERTSDYQHDDDSWRNGFTAGVYDTVSFFAAVAQGSGGIDSQKVTMLVKCLDGHGDKLQPLKTWVDLAVAGSSPNSSVVPSIVLACQR